MNTSRHAIFFHCDREKKLTENSLKTGKSRLGDTRTSFVVKKGGGISTSRDLDLEKMGFLRVFWITNPREFQDPKLEVLYHIRPYVVGIFPYIALEKMGFLRVSQLDYQTFINTLVLVMDIDINGYRYKTNSYLIVMDFNTLW